MNQQLSFFNTNQSTPSEVSQYGVECANQQDRVLAYFKAVKSSTALQVIDALFPMDQSSVRRCMSNLKRDGLLEKTNVVMVGSKGKKEHLYRLK